MPTNTLQVQIKNRTDTKERWASSNPVLLNGEFGIVQGTTQFKIGDGVRPWNELPFCEPMVSESQLIKYALIFS